MKASQRKQKSGVSVVPAEHTLRDFLTLPDFNTWATPGIAIELVQFPVADTDRNESHLQMIHFG